MGLKSEIVSLSQREEQASYYFYQFPIKHVLKRKKKKKETRWFNSISRQMQCMCVCVCVCDVCVCVCVCAGMCLLTCTYVLYDLSDQNWLNIYTYTEWPKPQTKLNFTFWNREKPYGLCPPCPQPAFCLRKNLSQRISLIRELRMQEQRKIVHQD